MGEPEKEKTEEFLEMVNGFPRDRGIRHMTAFHKRALEEEGLELSLGLSLNGKFGVEPKRAKTSALTCVSLVSCFMPGGGGGGGVGVESQARVFPDATSNPWTRTGSLPSETQEELRKRKELQSLRRLEAKKRRMEKLKFPRCGRDKIDSAENSSEENGSNIDSIGQDSGCNYANYNSNWMPSSQVSIGSQGSGSSVLSEFDSQPTQVRQNNEAVQSRHQNKKPQVPTQKSNSTFLRGEKEKTKETRMPFVSTIGNGPNGRKVDGFLYTYRKGEEVRIVCLCHGDCFSPAEFVKHAGGTDVENPLKHIAVRSSPPS